MSRSSRASPHSTRATVREGQELKFEVHPAVQHHVQELLEYLGEQCPDDLFDILSGNFQITIPLHGSERVNTEHILNFEYIPSKREIEQFVHLIEHRGGLWNEKLYPETYSWFPSCLPKDIYCYLMYIGKSTGINSQTWKTIDQIDKYWYWNLVSLAFEKSEEYSCMLSEFKSRYDEWRQFRLEAEERALKELGLHISPQHGSKSLISSFHLYSEKYYRGFPVPSSWTTSRRKFKNIIDEAIRTGNLSSLEDIVDYEYIQQSFPLGFPSDGEISDETFRIIEYYLTGQYRELSLYLRSMSLPATKVHKKRDETEILPGVQTVHSFGGQKPVYKIPEDLNQVLPGGVKLMSVLIAYPRSDPMSIVKQGITEQILAKRNSSLGCRRDLNKEPYYCLQIPLEKNPRYQYISILPAAARGRRSRPVRELVPEVIVQTPRIEIGIPVLPQIEAVKENYIDSSYLDSTLDIEHIKSRVEFVLGSVDHGPIHKYCRPAMWRVLGENSDRPCHYVGDAMFTDKYNPTDFDCLYSDDEYSCGNMEARTQQCSELNQMLHAISLVYRMGNYDECEVFRSQLGTLDDMTILSKVKTGVLIIPNYLNGKFSPDVRLPGYNTIVPHQHVNYSAPTYQTLVPLETHDQLQRIGDYKRYISTHDSCISEKRKKYTVKIYKHGLSHWLGCSVKIKDMIDLFTHVNDLDRVILQSVLSKTEYTVPDIQYWGIDDLSSEEEEEYSEDEVQETWMPEVSTFGLVIASPVVSPVQAPVIVHPIVKYSPSNFTLVQVCGGLAVRNSDLELYSAILEKLKREQNRKPTKAVTKSMKYVVVLDLQTEIPLYRAYENGTAVLYDPIYPVPNSNFLWISEHERTQGEKDQTRLSLQRCKKIPGLYYPKMSGEFILTEMNTKLEREMKEERLYAYKKILEHRESHVVYDKTIDNEMQALTTQTFTNSRIVIEPEYIYNQFTGLICAAVLLNDIVPCTYIYRCSRSCPNTIPLVNEGIMFPGKKTVFFPEEFNGYRVRLPTTEESVQIKKKWDENALILDSVRQMHYLYVQTCGSEFLHRLSIQEVNWEYVSDFFLGKKTASNILGCIYMDKYNEYQNELYLNIPSVSIDVDTYFRSLPTNYTQFTPGVPPNLSDYIFQQKRILSSKTTEVARAYISTIALDNKRHKDYVETEPERILKEARLRDIAKKRRSHTVIAPGPTADGYSFSVAGLSLQADPYVMCSSTQYLPAGILSDQEIPVNTTETYNAGKWTDITSLAYIPGIPERRTQELAYGGYISKDVYVASDNDLLSGRRSFHRKSIYPRVCQTLIEQGWIHPCDRMVDRDDGLIFTTEEDIYIAFHGDYDLQVPDPKYLLYVCTEEEVAFYYRPDFNVDIHRPRSHLLEEIPSFSSRSKKIAASRREYLKRYAINCFLSKLHYVHTVLSIIRVDSLRMGMMGVKYQINPGSSTVALHNSVTKTAHHTQTIFTSKPTIPFSSTDMSMLHQIYREVTLMTQSGIMSHFIAMVHNPKSDVLNLGYTSPEIYTRAGEIMLDVWYVSDVDMFEVISKLPLTPEKCLHYFTREHIRLMSVLSPYERYQLFLHYYRRIGDYLAEVSLRIPGQTRQEKDRELVIDAAIIYSLKQLYPLEAAAIRICSDPNLIRQRTYISNPEETYVQEILEKKSVCLRSNVKFTLGLCTSSLAQIERSKSKQTEIRSRQERKLEQDQQFANTQVNYYRKYLISIYKDNTSILEIAHSIKSSAVNVNELTEDLYQRIAETLPEQLPKSFWNKYYGYNPSMLERIYRRYLSECVNKEEVVLSHDLMCKLIDINEAELQELELSVYTQSSSFTCSLTDNLTHYIVKECKLPKIVTNPFQYIMEKNIALSDFCSYRGDYRPILIANESKFRPSYWKSVLASSSSTTFYVHVSSDDKMHFHYYNGCPLFLVPEETIRHIPSNMAYSLPVEILNHIVVDKPINSTNTIVEEEQETVPAGIYPRVHVPLVETRVPCLKEIPIFEPIASSPIKNVGTNITQDISADIQKIALQKNWIPTSARPVLRSRTENANSEYDRSTLKWNGSHLGKFPRAVILSTVKHEKLDMVELLLPLIEPDGSLHHYNVPCLMFTVKNKLGSLMDELASSFGLQKLGSHTLVISNSLRLIYRLDNTRPLTLSGIKDFTGYSPEFCSMLERIVIYQNFCGSSLEGKYILVSNGQLVVLLPKCLSEIRNTELSYFVTNYSDSVRKMLSTMSGKYNVILESMASRLTPECLEYIPTLISNIRRSTFVV